MFENSFRRHEPLSLDSAPCAPSSALFSRAPEAPRQVGSPLLSFLPLFFLNRARFAELLHLLRLLGRWADLVV